jgi:antibiotic biosynthesis monooxygenase (ABM) superfamily enzyme
MPFAHDEEPNEIRRASPRELNEESGKDEGRAVIFTIRAKKGREEELADWAHRIVTAAREREGNLAATVIRTSHPGEYRVFHQFRSVQSLQEWLDSDERQHLLAEAEPILQNDPERQLATGLETWFRLPSEGRTAPPPPRWKMWLTSVIAIYPLVLGFQAWVTPLMTHWPLVLRAAILPLVILSLMTFVVMPVVTRVLGPWLRGRR